jgi:hypothetical protein
MLCYYYKILNYLLIYLLTPNFFQEANFNYFDLMNDAELEWIYFRTCFCYMLHATWTASPGQTMHERIKIITNLLTTQHIYVFKCVCV